MVCCPFTWAPTNASERVPVCVAAATVTLVGSAAVYPGAVAVSVYVPAVVGNVIVVAVPAVTTWDAVRAVPPNVTPIATPSEAVTVTDRVAPSPVVLIERLFVAGCVVAGCCVLVPLPSIANSTCRIWKSYCEVASSSSTRAVTVFGPVI